MDLGKNSIGRLLGRPGFHFSEGDISIHREWIEYHVRKCDIILPLVAPVVANLGFDLVWFTILFAVCLQTSFLTPPVGFALFYLKGVAPEGIQLGNIYRGVIPFILIQIIGLCIVFYWQGLVTWLPAAAYSS